MNTRPVSAAVNRIDSRRGSKSAALSCALAAQKRAQKQCMRLGTARQRRPMTPRHDSRVCENKLGAEGADAMARAATASRGVQQAP
eukprot:4667253-Pleurochrysis_carterae.AAC.2